MNITIGILVNKSETAVGATDWMKGPSCQWNHRSCLFGFDWSFVFCVNRLIGLVVRRPPRERKIPGLNPACARIFSGSSHTSSSKICTPVATLPGAWHYRVCARTGRPGVSILWLGEVESLICNFYISVAAHKIVRADLSLIYTSMLKQQTNFCVFIVILSCLSIGLCPCSSPFTGMFSEILCQSFCDVQKKLIVGVVVNVVVDVVSLFSFSLTLYLSLSLSACLSLFLSFFFRIYL